MKTPIYLDHAATTPVRPEVLEAMLPFFGPRFGNPSSIHRWGREARTSLDEARERVAKCLGANPDEICFTSGGTEGDNLAILGSWRAVSDKRRAVVTTPIEHKAVLAAVEQIAREGGEARYLDVDNNGQVTRASAEALLDDAVGVCSIMWVNNEMGAMQDIPSFAELAKSRGILFHTDAVQAFAKVPIDVKQLPVDYLSFSGHKIGAPKGIGAMFIRRGTPVQPLMFGGSQDRGRRPGTENVAMVVGLAKAAELALSESEEECKRLEKMRDSLESALVSRIPDLRVNGREGLRAPHILSVSVPGTDSESLLMALDIQGIACSAGSACQSGSVSPSHVLCAMGVQPDLASAALRMSLGALTTEADIVRVAEVLPGLVQKARMAGVS